MNSGLEPPVHDFSKPLADVDAIRAVLPHRFEMLLLTGILELDPQKHRIVGYLDLKQEDFWARGHFPRFPVMPGVLMCEAAAQLTCYYTVTQKVVDEGSLMGLGGIESARFIRLVRPGDRLVMQGEGVRVNRRMTKFQVTGTVNGEKSFEALVVGVPLGNWEELLRAQAQAS